MPRYICQDCNTIHYSNPKVVVGTIPIREGKILMCKRAIEPRKGFWTLPCGFMENGETVEEGAWRETHEEARADVEIIRLHTVYSIPHIGQVYLMFLAQLNDSEFSPGPESLETELMVPEKIPWDQIAFPSIRFTLQNYLHTPRPNGPVIIGSYDRRINENHNNH